MTPGGGGYGQPQKVKPFGGCAQKRQNKIANKEIAPLEPRRTRSMREK